MTTSPVRKLSKARWFGVVAACLLTIGAMVVGFNAERFAGGARLAFLHRVPTWVYQMVEAVAVLSMTAIGAIGIARRRAERRFTHKR